MKLFVGVLRQQFFCGHNYPKMHPLKLLVIFHLFGQPLELFWVVLVGQLTDVTEHM